MNRRGGWRVSSPGTPFNSLLPCLEIFQPVPEKEKESKKKNTDNNYTNKTKESEGGKKKKKGKKKTHTAAAAVMSLTFNSAHCWRRSQTRTGRFPDI